MALTLFFFQLKEASVLASKFFSDLAEIFDSNNTQGKCFRIFFLLEATPLRKLLADVLMKRKIFALPRIFINKLNSIQKIKNKPNQVQNLKIKLQRPSSQKQLLRPNQNPQEKTNQKKLKSLRKKKTQNWSARYQPTCFLTMIADHPSEKKILVSINYNQNLEQIFSHLFLIFQIVLIWWLLWFLNAMLTFIFLLSSLTPSYFKNYWRGMEKTSWWTKTSK